MDNIKARYSDKLTYSKDLYSAVEGTDCLAIMTEWNVFRTPDFSQIKKLMKTNKIYDGRNLYDNQTMKELGFDYISIGRPSNK